VNAIAILLSVKLQVMPMQHIRWKKIVLISYWDRKRRKSCRPIEPPFFTRGWMNLVKRLIEDGIWTIVDARINFGYYDRLLLLEYESSPFTDEEILEFYDLIQVPIEFEKVSLNYFQGVLSRLFEQ
jgi:hypothetical protein